MKKGLLINQTLNEFYKSVRTQMPFGTTKRGFPLLIGKSKVSVVIFDLERESTISIGLFVPRKRYSRKTLLIRESGIVTEDTVGSIPPEDLTPHEPDFSAVSNKDIAIMAAIQLKALGYTKYASKKSKH